MGTDDERLLHSLISRNDRLQIEIRGLHKRCAGIVNAGVGVRREALEELYLYLKEKVRLRVVILRVCLGLRLLLTFCLY
jgi:hypothetical protein